MSDKFHWHEALDRSAVAAAFFDDNVLEHPVVMEVAALRTRAEQISELLHELYQEVGRLAP